MTQIFKLLAFIVVLVAAPLVVALQSVTAEEFPPNKDVFTPELLNLYARSYAKPQSLNAAFEYYRALNETERRNVPLTKTKITVPVLAIGGGGTGGFGTAQADQIRQYANRVEGLSIPGCGHWLPEECADPLNQAVVKFLAQK